MTISYLATDGYLFQTVVSALMARRHSSSEIFLCHLGDGESHEAQTFRSIAEARGVNFISRPTAVMRGESPLWARFHLDEWLPASALHTLYLDGDTQVLGDLGPLEKTIAEGTMVAARDPMVLINEVHPALSAKISSWWEESRILPADRQRYVNAGVFGLPLALLPELRSRIDALPVPRSALRFKDQDALNLVAVADIRLVSSRWNFPGFLLGTPLERAARPRIVHFMSEPRPWHARTPAWGSGYYQAYVDFVDEHPATEPFWQRHSWSEAGRYALQFAYKSVTERRQFKSGRSLETFRRLERDAPV